MNEQIPVVREVDRGTARLMPDIDRERAWLLTVDDAPQSYVDLDEPTHLEFEYTRRLAHVIDTCADEGTPLDLLHLGGGALTLPRYAAVTRPGSRQDVVEFDRGLLDLVAEQLPLPDGSGIALHAADARAWIDAAPADSADLLIADVFGGSRVPAQVTSVEYARAAERVLRPGGIYAANLADSAPFAFLGSQLATFAAVFAELAAGRRTGGAARTPLRQRPAARVPRPARHGSPRPPHFGGPVPRTRRARRRRCGGSCGSATPVADADAQASPEPPGGAFSIG